MKKQICLLTLSLIFLITSFIPSSFFVYAEVIEQNNTGIADFYLYNELLMLANQSRPEPLFKLETDALLAVEQISITNSQIASLEGLQRLNLSSVKTLDLRGNQLSIVTSEQLSTLTNLEQLNLANNSLLQIDVTALENLNTLILNNNKLTQINLSQISYNATLGTGYVNLKNNEFKGLEDITLPNELTDAITVDLNNNYLTNQNINEYTNTHSLNLAFQGVKAQEILLEGDLLSVYDNGYYYASFNIKIYHSVTQILLAEVFEAINIELEPNNYLLKYFDGESELYNEAQGIPEEFAPIVFQVKPQQPILEVYKDDERVDAKSVYDKGVTLQFLSYNPNAVIYYSLNNGVWVEDDSLELKNNGRYTLYVKVAFNEIESSLSVVTFEIQNSWQATLNVFKAFASITLLIILLAGGYYYKIKKSS